MAISPDFRINNNALPAPAQPMGWAIPDIKGDNGIGQKLYTAFFTYNLSWDYLTQTEYNTLYTVWQGHYNSGTAVTRLPQHSTPTYGFFDYTGTVMDEPIFGEYNENYVKNVKVTIRHIKV